MRGPQPSRQKQLPPSPPISVPISASSEARQLWSFFVKLEVLRKELKIPQGKPGKMVMGLWPRRWLCVFLSEADGKKE